jgi:peptide/nickel transport system substrate-binding protein
MKHMIVLIVMGALLLSPLLTLARETLAPGSGGVIVIGLSSVTISLGSLNPLRNYKSNTSRITDLMFPKVVGISPFTQYFGKVGDEGVYDALATDWSISADGLVYTLTLRQDAVWSDGVPITAADVKFSFDAMASGHIESADYGLTFKYDPVANPSGIAEIVVVDDHTFQAVFREANCLALQMAGRFPIAPAHVFDYDGNPNFNFSVMVGHPFDTNPAIVYGPFQLDYIAYGKEIALSPVQTWADGPVIPSGLIFRDVANIEDETERFLAGELDLIWDASVASFADIRAAPGVTAASFPSSRWDYLALNVADPENPRPGEDASGNRIDQGHHPLFGDVRVRRAMQLAINVPDIIQGALFGEGTQMASNLLPTSWAADTTLTPIPHDPTLAAQMLDEAGWPAGPEGIRICQGCQYALDGTPFEFELVTNEGNTRRKTVSRIVRDQLADLGIIVDLRRVAWVTLAADGQTYDSYISGYGEDYPDTGDKTWAFGSGSDYLSESIYMNVNNSSYYNPEFDRLSDRARTLPGCDPTARAEIYHQIEKLLQDDPPYAWLYAINDLYAAHTRVIGFDPQPNDPLWNIHTWQVERP